MKILACTAMMFIALSGIDHLTWLDQVQQHATPPQVDTSPHHSGVQNFHRYH